MGDLTTTFQFLITIPWRIIDLIAQKTSFTAFGVTVNLVSVILGFIVVGMVVSLFWRGAKG